MSHAADARRLLRACRSGALATLSQRLRGHPFASVVPFMSDFDASPIFLISRLAEHTKNIAFDSRVSLMVHEPNADVQAAARLTLAGLCERFAAPPALQDRYIRLFPDAAQLLALDFEFHRITATAIRYIGGFGKIHWLEPGSFSNSGGIDSELELAWLARINDSSRTHLLRHGDSSNGPDAAAAARAVAMDCDGIDIAVDTGVQRLPFHPSVASANELPRAVDGALARNVE